MGAAVAACDELVAGMRAALREGMVRKVKETEAREALDRELAASGDVDADADADAAKKGDSNAPA